MSGYLNHVRTATETLLGMEDDLEILPGVADGQAAVRAVQELRPDVCILDLKTPELDGVEASQDIARSVATKVIICNRHARPSALRAVGRSECRHGRPDRRAAQPRPGHGPQLFIPRHAEAWGQYPTRSISTCVGAGLALNRTTTTSRLSTTETHSGAEKLIRAPHL